MLNDERLSELKRGYFHVIILIEKAFFNAKLQGPAPRKEEVVIPFVSIHYSNFDSKRVSIATNSLLSNAKYNKLKKSV